MGLSTVATDRAELSSDLRHDDMVEQSPKKASKQILRHEIEEELDALDARRSGCWFQAFRPDWMWGSACS